MKIIIIIIITLNYENTLRRVDIYFLEHYSPW